MLAKDPMAPSEFASYPVQYSNRDVAQLVQRIEHVVLGEDRDLAIVALITYALLLQDPDLEIGGSKLQDILDSVSQHMCWVIQSGVQPVVDPKLMN